MNPHSGAPVTERAVASREAPRWLWALLGVWILATAATASWLAPVGAFRGPLCRAPAPSALPAAEPRGP